MPADLKPIYDNIAALLSAQCPPFKIKPEAKGFTLISPNEVIIDSRKFPELYFAAVLTQKNFVGFYFMPIYMNQPLLNKIPEELRKCLKGKTCFHIKKDDPELLKQIKDTLIMGKDCYKKRNWIK